MLLPERLVGQGGENDSARDFSVDDVVRVGLGVALEEADGFAQWIATILFWPTIISFALLKHLKK